LDSGFAKLNALKVINNLVLSESEEDSYQANDQSEEVQVFNQTHANFEQVSSGYSTISSGKEEAYLTRHLLNTAAAKAASKGLV